MTSQSELAKAMSIFGTLGGKSRSEAKTAANRAKMRKYWEDVRAGTATAPRRPKKGGKK